MSPEINVQGNLIAKVPDETGTYQTLRGKELYVNVDGIDASNKKQTVILKGDEIGGERVLGLTHEGIGNSEDPKRGDQLLPTISISLLAKPIRVSYKRSKWASSKSLGNPRGGQYREYKETYKNPRWTKGHGQR